jgi:2'-5' RNA ligase
MLKKERGLKLVHPENYHITLAFIGDVELDLLESIDKSLERLASGLPVIDVQFNRIGTFPSVIYLKISEGERELADLSKNAKSILAQNGIPYDAKPFKGHLTIARSRERRVKAIEFLKSYACDARFDIFFEVLSFSMIQSELTSTGPIYTTLNKYYLKEQEVK